jgi:hypothetical protein
MRCQPSLLMVAIAFSSGGVPDTLRSTALFAIEGAHAARMHRIGRTYLEA